MARSWIRLDLVGCFALCGTLVTSACDRSDTPAPTVDVPESPQPHSKSVDDGTELSAEAAQTEVAEQAPPEGDRPSDSIQQPGAPPEPTPDPSGDDSDTSSAAEAVGGGQVVPNPKPPPSLTPGGRPGQETAPMVPPN